MTTQLQTTDLAPAMPNETAELLHAVSIYSYSGRAMQQGDLVAIVKGTLQSYVILAL